ncbi:isochorismatase family protein [Rhizobium leguminosarum]|uniref:isochorismatase family protein n=1 Tax=Rhizobium leguminosarum TaxID=384 RepID=UPI0006863655|nr:isochorismatase family protein [Rhizobium leguminosarum]
MTPSDIARRDVLMLMAAGVAVSGLPQLAAAASSTTADPKSQKPSPQNAVWNHDQVALLIIDYQPEMFAAIRSETSAEMIELNTLYMIKIAKALDIPIVLSSVGVELGVNSPTVKSIADELSHLKVIDRSTMDAWEDENFLAAVKATGKKRLIFGALFSEVCLAFPVVDALKEGYEVTFVADMVGGQSQIAHISALQRITQAGAIPNSVLGLSAELFRDWKSLEAQKAKPEIIAYLGELHKRGLR